MADQVEQLNLIVMAITVFIKQAPMHQILQWHFFLCFGEGKTTGILAVCIPEIDSDYQITDKIV